MLAHHICGIVPFGLGTYYREFMYFSPIIVLAECSTPFVNARWFMSVSHNTGSIWYALNGLMMWLSFLLCRIIWLPYGCRELIARSTEYLTSDKYHLSVIIPIFVGTPIAYLLSAYWFVLITKGLVKVALGIVKGSKKSHQQQQQQPQQQHSSTTAHQKTKKVQ